MEPTNGNNKVFITNREIYDEVCELKEIVVELKYSAEARMKELLEDKNRIRALELKFYAVIAGLVGSFTVLVAHALGFKL